MPAELAVEAVPVRRDALVLGLVSTGHFFSHFFGIALPPLFPLIQADLAVSYVALGALLATANAATMLCQLPVGVLVDRFGARRLLVLGLALMSGAIAAIGVAPGYGVILLLMLLVGLGNSVFHPADYAIMATRISPQRLGRAFSLHTFAGHVGWALSPVTLAFLTTLWGWRAALIAAGLCGLAAAIWILLRGQALDAGSREGARSRELGAPRAAAAAPGEASNLRLLTSAPILLFFLYMVFAAIGSGGLNGFAVTVLVETRGVPLASANLALTTLLVTGALGVLLGGLLADRTRRHDIVVVGGFLVAAAVLAILGLVPAPLAALLVGLATVGLAQGMIRPSRDMMVRAVAPVASVGTVFGFVTAGMNVGGALAPIFFGWLIDRGLGGGVFVFAAAAMLLALGAALLANSRAVAQTRAQEGA